LDHLLILNERHLDYVLRQYSQYYTRACPHQGLRQQIPQSLNRQPGHGAVQRRNILGGLIHDSYCAAAYSLLERRMEFSHLTGRVIPTTHSPVGRYGELLMVVAPALASPSCWYRSFLPGWHSALGC
jgi:hypothetical protein